MSKLPHPDWRHTATTSTANLYRVSENVLGLIPIAPYADTFETASENLGAIEQHWTDLGHGGATVIFMEQVLEQSAEARTLYANQSGNNGTLCYALISQSRFSQAASSVYTGLARPSVPTQVFQSLEDAQAWINKTIATPA